MKKNYTLGLSQVQQELTAMRMPGCYWITCNRFDDARIFTRQVIGHQDAAILISADEKPRSLLTPEPERGPTRIPLYSLPASKRALLRLDSDLARILTVRSGLVVLFINVASWNQLSAEELTHWVKKIKKSVTLNASTLLIVTWGPTIINLLNHLQSYFRQLDGMAHLEYQQDSWQYRLNWWYSEERVFADRTIRLNCVDETFTAFQENEQTAPLSLNDEHLYMAEQQVLEGAPPLSRDWLLFSDNSLLFSRAQQANSATVIFNLSRNEQIASLAEMIHSLRRAR